jgi:hypothetical protein
MCLLANEVTSFSISLCIHAVQSPLHSCLRIFGKLYVAIKRTGVVAYFHNLDINDSRISTNFVAHRPRVVATSVENLWEEA